MDFKEMWNNSLIKSSLLGAVTALSFAPFNIFPIFLATFAWLFVRIYEVKDTKRLMAESFCFFFFLHVACLYWLAYPLTFDVKHWMLIPFAITLIPAYLSLPSLLAILLMKLTSNALVTWSVNRSDSPVIWSRDRLIRSGVLGAIAAILLILLDVVGIRVSGMLALVWPFIRMCREKITKQLLAESYCFCFFLSAVSFAPLLMLSMNGLPSSGSFRLSSIFLNLSVPNSLVVGSNFLMWSVPILIIFGSIVNVLPMLLVASIVKRFRPPFVLLFPIVFAIVGYIQYIMQYDPRFEQCLLEFPWLDPAYIWGCHEIFLQTLNLYKTAGLNFVTLTISACLGAAFYYHKQNEAKKSIISASISVSLFLFILLFGWYRLANNPTKFTDKKIRIVQCNIPQEKKNDKNFAYSNLMAHLEKSRHNSKVDFVIWPEASVPYLYKDDFKQLHDYLKTPLNEGEYLLAGAVRKDLSTEKVYNSVVVIDHNGKNVGHYDKHYLVPFGEYVPFRKYLPFQGIASDIGDFDRGTGANFIELNGLKVAFMICYEVAFSALAFFSCLFQNPDLIINVTNDGWFGLTTEPFQHLQISRARAIENGVPLVRATNFGISAVFDAYGREIARVPINQAGVIEVNVPKKASNAHLRVKCIKVKK